VDGTLKSPFWIAGRVNGLLTGAESILTSKGQNDCTFQRTQTGYSNISWMIPHPVSSIFMVFAEGEGTGRTWNILRDTNRTTLANTAKSCTFIVRNNSFVVTDGIINGC